jgi:very-short-patch-repair endonuclease
VLAHADTELTPASVARAAALALGAEAVISHTTAALVETLKVPPDPEVHAIVARERRVRMPGVRAHRIEIEDAEITRVDGIVCTSLLRTALDCLLWLPEEAGRALAVDALRRGLFTADELTATVAAAPQRHGLQRAWSVVRDVSGGAHSEAEVRCHRLLRAAGIGGWRANAQVHDVDGLIGIVDLLFESASLVVEIDGRAFHSDAQTFQRDRTRQNRLIAAGYSVLRFTWDDLVRRPEYVVQQIRVGVQRGRAAS